MSEQPCDCPEPPVNVRLVLTNGREVAVSCVYLGLDGDVHRWRALPPPGMEPEEGWRLRGVRVDSWPPRTSISFPGVLARGPQ